MNHAISKLAKRYSHAVINREQQMKITGGLAMITCSFSVPGVFDYGGPCSSSSMSVCMQSAGSHASMMSASSGFSVNYNCTETQVNID